MLSLIPLLPFTGFLINAAFGRRLTKGVSGAVACLAMLGAFGLSLLSAMRLLASSRARPGHRPAPLHLDAAPASPPTWSSGSIRCRC